MLLVEKLNTEEVSQDLIDEYDFIYKHILDHFIDRYEYIDEMDVQDYYEYFIADEYSDEWDFPECAPDCLINDIVSEVNEGIDDMTNSDTLEDMLRSYYQSVM